MDFERQLYGYDDLNRLIDPKIVAVVGASPAEGSFGHRTLENLNNFEGTVYGINPKYDDVMGYPTFPSLSDLPETPDCVIIAVGKNLVDSVVQEAADLGVGGAVIYASGYLETGNHEDYVAQRRLVATAREGGLHLAGPNCIGLVNVNTKAAMNFMTDAGELINHEAGRISVVSQSGALGYALLQGLHRGISFSKFLACGNSADIDVADYVSYLAEDPETSTIVCLLEGISDGNRFIEAVLKAGRAGKPVIVYKAANSETSSKAAMSHTGTLAGSAEAYRAAFERAGAILVDDFEALTEVATFFDRNTEGPTGPGVGIMATSGGAGVICADKAEEHDLGLPPLAEDTQRVLQDLVPGFGSLANPADLTAEILKNAETFKGSLTAFCDDPSFGAVVIPFTFVHENTTGVRAKYLSEVATESKTPLAAVWMNEWLEGPGSRELDSHDAVTIFRSPSRCMWTIRKWMDWHARTDWSSTQDHAREENPGKAALDNLRGIQGKGKALNESDAKEIVAAYGINVPQERLVQTPEEAAAVAEELGFPLVLKVVSSDILHKSDVGGVKVNLTSGAEVQEALTVMSARIAQEMPEATIDGYSLQTMASDGPELLLGARFDPIFGPLILLGSGGVWVEILRDARVYLPQLDHAAALKAVHEMTLAPVLQGARGEQSYDLDAIADVVVRFAALVQDLDGIAAEVELNPVRITRDHGPIAVDALVILQDNQTPQTVPASKDPLATEEGTQRWASV